MVILVGIYWSICLNLETLHVENFHILNLMFTFSLSLSFSFLSRHCLLYFGLDNNRFWLAIDSLAS